MGTLVLGKAIAERIRAGIKSDVEGLYAKHGRHPGLAIITADPGTVAKQSEVLVHESTALALGIQVRKQILPAEASQEELIAAIHAANQDPAIDGVLVLLPLPEHIDQSAVFAEIDPGKELEGLLDGDDDGAEGDQAQGDAAPAKPSSTITALQRLLDEIGFDAWRSRIVFLTEDRIRDNPIVARLLVMASRAGVQVAVASTQDPQAKSITRNADLVVISVSTAELVDDSYLKRGAVVVDFLPIQVGEKYSEAKGRLVPVLKTGVNVEAALRKASHVTPSVGGLGPIAIASMMENLLVNCRQLLEPAA